MAINNIVQTIADARVDARSLSEFVFKPAGFKVTRRLAPTIDTLQFYVNSLSLAVTEAQGKVEYIETTVQDAINNTAVEGGVLADTFVTVTSQQGQEPTTQRELNGYTITQKSSNIYATSSKPDGLDSTTYIQSLIDKLPDGGTLNLNNKTYVLSKSEDFSDIYPNNDQPCLVIRDKKNITIKNGALRVMQHGQGILDFKNSSGIITDLTIAGSANFPPLDTAGTGRGEKGIEGAGYFNQALYNTGAPRNNSIDTSGYSGGKMGTDDLFPQWGGGRAATWGVWNGGYIFNMGSGVYLINSDIKIDNCEIYGFNDAAIVVAGSKKAVVTNCKLHDCYSSGVFIKAYGEGAEVSTDSIHIEGNIIYNIGHPDAQPTHSAIDPGYGVSTSNKGGGTAGVRKYTVINNKFESCRRKAIDAHHSHFARVSGNLIEDCGHGIQIVANDSSGVLVSTIISDNYIKDIAFTTNLPAHAILINNAKAKPSEDLFKGSATISGNIIKNVGSNIVKTPSASLANGRGIEIDGVKHCTISGNVIDNDSNILGSIAISDGTGLTVSVPNSTISSNIVRGAFLFGVFSRKAVTPHPENGTGAVFSMQPYNFVGMSSITGNAIETWKTSKHTGDAYGIYSDSSVNVSSNTVIPHSSINCYGGVSLRGESISFRLNLADLSIIDLILPEKLKELNTTDFEVKYSSAGSYDRITVSFKPKSAEAMKIPLKFSSVHITPRARLSNADRDGLQCGISGYYPTDFIIEFYASAPIASPYAGASVKQITVGSLDVTAIMADTPSTATYKSHLAFTAPLKS